MTSHFRSFNTGLTFTSAVLVQRSSFLKRDLGVRGNQAAFRTLLTLFLGYPHFLDGGITSCVAWEGFTPGTNIFPFLSLSFPILKEGLELQEQQFQLYQLASQLKKIFFKSLKLKALPGVRWKMPISQRHRQAITCTCQACICMQVVRVEPNLAGWASSPLLHSLESLVPK